MPEYVAGPRKVVTPGTQNPFDKDTADLSAERAARGAIRDGTKPDKLRPDPSNTYQQQGNALGALGNAAAAIVGRRNPE